MSLRIPSPKALTKPEAYLAYKAGILSSDELKQNLYNPLNNYEGWLAKWCGLLETYPTNKDGTPQCLTDEEGLLAYLCGVTDRYPASNSRPDDARISAYIRYLVSARYTRPDHPLNREEFYLSLIKTQFIPSGNPSSDIVIDGTTKAPFVDVKLYGDTYQQTYSGKNLLELYPGHSETITNNGITATYDADEQTVTFNGVCDSDNITFIILNEDVAITARTTRATTYWLGGSVSGYCTVRFFDNSYQGLSYSIATLSSTTPIISNTTSNTTTISRYTSVRFNQGSVATNFKLKFMVADSEDTTYEPYVGGQPSPNPNYPQPIKTVTGLQTVEVQGKNLFDSSVTPEYYGRQTVTGGTDGSMELSVTTSNSNVTWSEFAEYLLQLEPNTTYTLSRKWEVVSGEQYRYAGAIRTRIGSSYSAATTSDKLTFTTDASGVTRLLFYTAYLDQTQGQVSTAVRFYDVLLEKGDTVTSFVQYSKQLYTINLGNIKLCNLTDHEDYIYEYMGDWILHKETVSAKISNDITWVTEAYAAQKRIYAQSGTVFGDRIVWPENNVHKANLKCDHFSTIPVGSILDGTADGIGCSSSGYISIRCSSTKTAQELLDILAENDITAIAAVYTPTDTVITNQNLIDQLNALKQGGAEEGTTYIKVSATDPNLPAKLYVEAPKYD